VLERARQLLSELSVQHVGRPRVSRSRRSDKPPADDAQLALFADPAQELLTTLAGTKIDELTPMQAFDLLRQWKQKFGK
jgi:DNA mismatch repair ATPase MutS